MRSSDWSSDGCSSDLLAAAPEDEPADRHDDQADRGQHTDQLVHPAKKLPFVPGDTVADDTIDNMPFSEVFARGLAPGRHVIGNAHLQDRKSTRLNSSH